MRTKKLVSIIMPAYNAGKYIEEAIESVLKQTYSNWELIIVDDKSSDDTVEKIKAYQKNDERIRLYQLAKNHGCAFARNFGLEKSTGEYIAFLDSDDIWLNRKLEEQLKFIAELPKTISFTAYSIIDSESKNKKNRHTKRQLNLVNLLKENSVIFSTVFCRYEDIANIKFQAEWYHEDYIFLLDCVNQGLKIQGLDLELCSYRVHGNGRSFNKINAAKHRWKIYRNYLKLSFSESFYYFLIYAFNGVIKYA